MIKALAGGLLIVAAVTSAPFFAASAFALAPLVISAHAEALTGGSTPADRISGAFAALSESVADPAIAAAAVRAPKGDFAPACASAVWPNIDAACLTTADGRPAPHVRMITIGSRIGENTTVLVRTPVAEMAQR